MANAVQTGKDHLRRIAAAEQIAVEASRLARMAAANQFSLLSYLFDMAALEAWREATESDGQTAQLRDSAHSLTG